MKVHQYCKVPTKGISKFHPNFLTFIQVKQEKSDNYGVKKKNKITQQVLRVLFFFLSTLKSVGINKE